MKIKELPMDQKTTITLLLTSIEEKETRNSSPYCTLTLTDGIDTIIAQLWNTKKENVKVQEKTLISAEIYKKMYNESVSYEVYQYGPAADTENINDYIVHAPYDSQKMFDRILDRLDKGVKEPTALSEFTKQILFDNYDKILTWSAASKIHHNCRGGWLYHTFRMVESAYYLRCVYQVDAELLICGTILHDIGKLKELDTDNLGTAEYTIPGTLFGHSTLGIEMIDKAYESWKKEIHKDLPEERVMLLKHMIASHHGKLEYGAITVPSIPEAMILHELDMIDSRIYQFEQVRKDLEPGSMSDKIFGLDTRVYRPL